MATTITSPHGSATSTRPAAADTFHAIAGTLDLVGERWSLLVLREVFLGVRRFADIQANTGAPRDVLTKRLRSLEAAGILERHRYQDHPARFDYHLTRAGQALEPVLIGLREWGIRHLPDPPPAQRFLHTCGADVTTRVVCAECGEPLEGGGLVTVAAETGAGTGDPGYATAARRRHRTPS